MLGITSTNNMRLRKMFTNNTNTKNRIGLRKIHTTTNTTVTTIVTNTITSHHNKTTAKLTKIQNNTGPMLHNMITVPAKKPHIVTTISQTTTKNTGMINSKIILSKIKNIKKTIIISLITINNLVIHTMIITLKSIIHTIVIIIIMSRSFTAMMNLTSIMTTTTTLTRYSSNMYIINIQTPTHMHTRWRFVTSWHRKRNAIVARADCG